MTIFHKKLKQLFRQKGDTPENDSTLMQRLDIIEQMIDLDIETPCILCCEMECVCVTPDPNEQPLWHFDDENNDLDEDDEPSIWR